MVNVSNMDRTLIEDGNQMGPASRPLYRLMFSEGGRFEEGVVVVGDNEVIISRDNFGFFAMKHSDHINWMAKNLPKDACNEVKELFSLGF